MTFLRAKILGETERGPDSVPHFALLGPIVSNKSSKDENEGESAFCGKKKDNT